MADQFDNSPLIKSIFRDSSERMEFFHKKLESEGVLRGIIGPRDVDILWERHIFNSAALLPYIKAAAGQVSKKGGSGKKAVVGDIGSGGGFPGIVLASTLPDIDVYKRQMGYSLQFPEPQQLLLLLILQSGLMSPGRKYQKSRKG